MPKVCAVINSVNQLVIHLLCSHCVYPCYFTLKQSSHQAFSCYNTDYSQGDYLDEWLVCALNQVQFDTYVSDTYSFAYMSLARVSFDTIIEFTGKALTQVISLTGFRVIHLTLCFSLCDEDWWAGNGGKWGGTAQNAQHVKSITQASGNSAQNSEKLCAIC